MHSTNRMSPEHLSPSGGWRPRRLLPIVILALAACGRAAERADGGKSDSGAYGGSGSGGTAGRDEGAAGAGGGTAGTGGGDSGFGGVAGATSAADCFDLSGAPVGRYDFRVTGSGFDAYDGEKVRAVVVYMSGAGHGLGEATIRNGSFEIALPKTNEPYTGYGVYIDRGRDNACTLDVDPFFQMTSGGVYQDVSWEINPQTHYLQGLPPCNIDGIFDLTLPLPCSSGEGGRGGGGGASGAGGSGDADGGSNVDGAPGADAPDAATNVTIIRGDPAKKFATGTFTARGFGPEYEGRLVFVRVGTPTRPPERLGAGWAPFGDGGFSLPLPMGIERSLYKAKYAFIDVDGDGVCTADKDVVYQDFSFLDDDLTFVLEGSVPAASGTTERTMPRTRGVDIATPVCAIMNGPWPAS